MIFHNTVPHLRNRFMKLTTELLYKIRIATQQPRFSANLWSWASMKVYQPTKEWERDILRKPKLLERWESGTHSVSLAVVKTWLLNIFFCFHNFITPYKRIEKMRKAKNISFSYRIKTYRTLYIDALWRSEHVTKKCVKDSSKEAKLPKLHPIKNQDHVERHNVLQSFVTATSSRLL